MPFRSFQIAPLGRVIAASWFWSTANYSILPITAPALVEVTRGDDTGDTGNLNTSQIHFCEFPTIQDCNLDSVSMRFDAAGTGEIVTAYIDPGTQNLVLEDRYPVTVSSGLNSYAVDQPISAGRFVGYYRITGSNLRWKASYNHAWVNNALITSGTLAYNTNTAVPALSFTTTELSVTLDPGLQLGSGRNGVIGYGQSKSIGKDATPIISSTPSGTHLTFGNGPKTTQPGFGTVASDDDGTEKALVEDTIAPATGVHGETLSTGFAEQYDTEHGASPPVWFASVAGKGATFMSALDYFSDPYQNMIYHVVTGKARATDAGAAYSVAAIPFIHGESDQQSSTLKADYKHYLDLTVTQARWEIGQITGQARPPNWLFTTTAFQITTSKGASDAILEVCDERDDCFYVVPDYRLPHVNNVHLSAAGEKLLGAYMGRAAHQLAQGNEPDRLKWISASASGTTLTAVIEGASAAQLDAGVIIGSATDFGIKVQDDTGTLTLSSIAIGSTSVVDGKVLTNITMTLNRTLGANPKFRYALDFIGVGIPILNGASGNIFDSNADTVSIDGTAYSLAMPAPHCELNVSV